MQSLCNDLMRSICLAHQSDGSLGNGRRAALMDCTSCSYSSACNMWPDSSTSSSSGAGESSSFGRSTLGANSDSVTPDLEGEVQSVSTVSPVNIPNHQPLFKSLQFHEHLLTRSFEGDQHFFRSDGSVAAYTAVPGSEARDPVTMLVPHEDAPAFSDVAATATAAATSSPPTSRLPLSLPQKTAVSKERIRGEEKMEPTTGPLTTQVSPNNRGSAGSPSWSGWSGFPAGGHLGPSSARTDKGEDRGTMLAGKASRGSPPAYPTLPSREQGMTHPSASRANFATAAMQIAATSVNTLHYT